MYVGGEGAGCLDMHMEITDKDRSWETFMVQVRKFKGMEQRILFLRHGQSVSTIDHFFFHNKK